MGVDREGTVDPTQGLIGRLGHDSLSIDGFERKARKGKISDLSPSGAPMDDRPKPGGRMSHRYPFNRLVIHDNRPNAGPSLGSFPDEDSLMLPE